MYEWRSSNSGRGAVDYFKCVCVATWLACTCFVLHAFGILMAHINVVVVY